jgi:hypothetical protein
VGEGTGSGFVPAIKWAIGLTLGLAIMGTMVASIGTGWPAVIVGMIFGALVGASAIGIIDRYL